MELEQKIFTIHMETQKTLNSKVILKGKNEAKESTFLTSDYTTKLQSSKPMILAQKQKYRPMEQDRKLKNKPTHSWVPYF